MWVTGVQTCALPIYRKWGLTGTTKIAAFAYLNHQLQSANLEVLWVSLKTNILSKTTIWYVGHHMIYWRKSNLSGLPLLHPSVEDGGALLVADAVHLTEMLSGRLQSSVASPSSLHLLLVYLHFSSQFNTLCFLPITTVVFGTQGNFFFICGHYSRGRRTDRKSVV